MGAPQERGAELSERLQGGSLALLRTCCPENPHQTKACLNPAPCAGEQTSTQGPNSVRIRACVQVLGGLACLNRRLQGHLQKAEG